MKVSFYKVYLKVLFQGLLWTSMKDKKYVLVRQWVQERRPVTMAILKKEEENVELIIDKFTWGKGHILANVD